jgi:hypothetical protein
MAGLGAAGAKKPKKPKTCPKGKLFATVSVPARGATVSTPNLRQGQRFRLRAVGVWATNASDSQDAFAAFQNTDPSQTTTVVGGVRVGLSVDGGSPDQWGSYNQNHVYERRVVGQGASLSLRNTDPVPGDNAGSLIVDVFCD